MIHGANLCFNRSVSIFTTQRSVTGPTHHTQREVIGQKAKRGTADGYFHQPSLAAPLVTAFASVESDVSSSTLLLLLLSLPAPQTQTPKWLRSVQFQR